MTEAPVEEREIYLPLVVVAVLFVAGIGYAIVDRTKSSDTKPEVALSASQSVASGVPEVDPSIIPEGAPTPLPSMPPRELKGEDRRFEIVRSQIRQVVMQQEIHYNDNMTYAKSVGEFREFGHVPGVRLTIVNGSSTGYGVYATHDDLRDFRCAFYIGSAPPVAPASTLGKLICTEPS